MSFDPEFVPVYDNALAKDVTANAADDYTVTLKDGIKFSNGNDVTADDVVYSFDAHARPRPLGVRRVRTARVARPGRLTKVDDRTVNFKLSKPCPTSKRRSAPTCAQSSRSATSASTVTRPRRSAPAPYALKEFEVGKQSVHVKNEFYWEAGKPIFDEVHIIDFADADAMINALLADQIDVADDIPSAASRRSRAPTVTRC